MPEPDGRTGGQDPSADRLLEALVEAGRDGATVLRLSRTLREPPDAVDAAARALHQQRNLSRLYSARGAAHDRLLLPGAGRSRAPARTLRRLRRVPARQLAGAVLAVLALTTGLAWLGTGLVQQGCLPWEEPRNITDTLHCDDHVSWRVEIIGF